ncbi:MAG: LysE family translocator [Rhodoferax sp.]|uniref:LysE family translocator n=1 Tax=Rhodoferax sp. TaxID=50421 RepID=UPI002620DAB1|nr:LysE family translocator [Rhodoferax sp.]MDD2879439.1 LysE family translocator [Rhodoferax sp.]
MFSLNALIADDLRSAIGRLILPVSLFAVVTSASPGPVNIVAASSGVLFGLRRSWRQVLGASLGFALLLLMLGYGAGTLLARWETLQSALRWVGSIFLLYLAWQIYKAPAPGEQGQRMTQPPRFRDGLLAQWVNPKAWIVAATGVSSYTLPGTHYLASVWLLAGVFFMVCLPSIGAWAAFGTAARHLLTYAPALRWFNRSMALMLLASVLSLWL